MNRKLAANGDRASAEEVVSRSKAKKSPQNPFRDVVIVRPTVKPSVPRQRIVKAVREIMNEFESEIV